MMCHYPPKRGSCELLVDGVSMTFSHAPYNIRVSTNTFHTLLESYKNSWETMVTLRTTRTSAVKETYFLRSSCFL